jgi:hypothetical protein
MVLSELKEGMMMEKKGVSMRLLLETIKPFLKKYLYRVAISVE